MTAHRGRPQSPFSFREREFVCEFLRSFNRTTAALKAGYTAKRADKVGSKLLATPRIRNEIARRQGERLKKQELTAERTLEEIRRLMTSDITNYFDDEGKLLNLKNLPEDMRAAIASVKLNENGKIIDLKLWSKLQATHLAATHLRLLVELSEQKTSLEIRIREMTRISASSTRSSSWKKPARCFPSRSTPGPRNMPWCRRTGSGSGKPKPTTAGARSEALHVEQPRWRLHRRRTAIAQAQDRALPRAQRRISTCVATPAGKGEPMQVEIGDIQTGSRLRRLRAAPRPRPGRSPARSKPGGSWSTPGWAADRSQGLHPGEGRGI
jgi:hypothetical protein